MSQTPYSQEFAVGKILQITVPDGFDVTNAGITTHYSFLRWEDGSTNLTRTITMNGNKTLNATYVAPNQAGFPLWTLIPIGAFAVYEVYRRRKKK